MATIRSFLDFPTRLNISAKNNYAKIDYARKKNRELVVIQQGQPVPDHELNEIQARTRDDLVQIWRFLGDLFEGDAFKIEALSSAGDFTIKAGQCVVGGHSFLLKSDIKYSEQGAKVPDVLRKAFWGMDTFPEGYNAPIINTPTVARRDLIVLTLALYEYNYLDDSDLMDADLGVETAGRLVVKAGVSVVENFTGELSDISTEYTACEYFNNSRIFRAPLAYVDRTAGSAVITASMITDIRNYVITRDTRPVLSLANLRVPKQKNEIVLLAEGFDLNTIQNTYEYYGVSLTNRPTSVTSGSAGHVKHTELKYTSKEAKQLYTNASDWSSWIRSRSSDGVWSDWVLITDDDGHPINSDYSQYLGGIHASHFYHNRQDASQKKPVQQLGDFDLDELLSTGTFMSSGFFSTSSAWPSSLGRSLALVENYVSENDTYMSGAGTGARMQRLTSPDLPAKIWARSFAGSPAAWSSWVEVSKSGGTIITEDYLPPIGSIVAIVQGYFTGASNEGFTPVVVSLSDRWRVCDGSVYFDSDSPIFNIEGRRLPNLTDNRFLMGSLTPGAFGGSNDGLAHTHSFTQPSEHTITQAEYTVPQHGHTILNQPEFSVPAHVHPMIQPVFLIPDHTHAWYSHNASPSTGAVAGYTFNIAGRLTGVAGASTETGTHICWVPGPQSYTSALGGVDGTYPALYGWASNYTSLQFDTSAKSVISCVRKTDASVSLSEVIETTRTVDATINNCGSLALTRTVEAAVSAHTGGAVGAVARSVENANIPKYLGCKYVIRTK